MSFKDNLKRKMLINELSQTVSQSVGSSGAYRKVDKETMRKLLSFSPFVSEKRRDLELYFRELEPGTGEIMVLDNELGLYGKTSLDDVVLRKSPELKEMVSIRNIIKILNDSDILICKGRDTVDYIRDRSLELLDLRYEERDIEEMAEEGIEALVRVDSQGVMDTLDLFIEVLRYEPVPATALVNDYVMFGDCHEEEDGSEALGPIFMYNDKTNTLRLIKNKVYVNDPVQAQVITNVALGEANPEVEGLEVFKFLKNEVLAKKQPTVH